MTIYNLNKKNIKKTIERKISPIGFSFFFLFLTLNLYAQNHYWLQQYGSYNALMGGSLVGGVRDNGAIFYNPGAAGFIEKTDISVNANIYGIELINLKNGAGTDLNIQSNRPFFYPQLLAGIISTKKTPRLKIMYGLITRGRNITRFNVINKMIYDVIPEAEGDEFYAASMDYDNNYNDMWGGLGVAYKISPKFSIGGTCFVSYLHFEKNYLQRVNTDAIYNGVPFTAIFNQGFSHIIDNFSMIFKIGAALDLKKTKLGLTITLPSLNIFGMGRTFKYVEAFNLDKYPGANNSALFNHPSIIISDDQRGFDIQYKNPASIAAGFTQNFKSTIFSISAEYFFPIKTYEFINTEDLAIVRPVEAENPLLVKNFLDVDLSASDVLNVGMGVDQQLKGPFHLLMSVRTDFNNKINMLSRAQAEQGKSLSFSNWHYVHFGLGATYKRVSSDLSVGVNYGLGISNSKRQIANFSEPSNNNFLLGINERTAEVSVHNIGLVVGFTYYIKRN